MKWRREIPKLDSDISDPPRVLSARRYAEVAPSATRDHASELPPPRRNGSRLRLRDLAQVRAMPRPLRHQHGIDHVDHAVARRDVGLGDGRVVDHDLAVLRLDLHFLAV